MLARRPLVLVASREVRATLARLHMDTIGRQRGQSAVLHRAADREVIEQLELPGR